MKQTKNTINAGDALKDSFTRVVKKVSLDSDYKWLGAVESDRSEQGYDLTLSPQAFKALFGRSGGFGSPRVRIHFGWSSFAYLKGGSNFNARADYASKGFDFMVHVRKDKSGRYLGLVVPQLTAKAFIEKFGREKSSKWKGTFIQLDGYELSDKGLPCRKWEDFISGCGGWVVDLTDLGFEAEDTMDAVNEVGRVETQKDTSNALNSKRKTGSYYARAEV